MAGDWIKMRGNLWDDPRVSKLCDSTDSKEASIVGGLYWLWNTADQHTENGILPGLTLRQVDRKTGIKGFGAALVDIGWLTESADGLAIVRFEEHNGASAKKRAVTAKRVANHRVANDGVTPPALQDDDGCDTGALAREREEKEKNSSSLRSEEKPRKRSPLPARPDGVDDQTWVDWVALRKRKRADVSQTTLDGARAEANKAGMPLQRFLEIWCLRGSQGLQADWLRADERRPPINGNKHAAAAAGVFGQPQRSSGDVIDV